MKSVLLQLFIGIWVLAGSAFGDGIVAHYNFDNDATDLSGNGNHGVVYGATLTNDALFGMCYSFDGVDDYIHIANSDTLNTRHFSVVAWAKSRCASASVDRGIIGKHKCFVNNTSYWLYQNAEHIQCTMFGQRNNSYHDLAATNGCYNQWKMYTVTYDGQTLRLFENDTLISEEIVDGYIGNTLGYLIGAGEWSYGADTPQRWWDGLIDEVMIFDYPLSASQISDIYMGNGIPETERSALTCRIQPCEAVRDGAMWRIEGLDSYDWMMSGETVTNLLPGYYEVICAPIDNWLEPDIDPVITSNGTITVQAVYDPRPTNKLVAHYTFDIENGAIVEDCSGFGNDGVATNITYVLDGLCNSSAIECNGESSYIQVPSSSTFDCSNFTVSVWAKTFTSNTVVDRGMIGKHRCHHNQNYFWLYQHENTIEATMIGTDYGNFCNLNAPLDSIYNEWGMLTITYDQEIFRLYVNGVEADSDYVPGYSGGNPYDLLIGAGEFTSGGTAPQRWWLGQIADVKIYEHALSANEISDMYDADIVCSGDGPEITSITPADGSLFFRWVQPMYIVVSEGTHPIQQVTVDGNAATYDSAINAWTYVINWCQLQGQSKEFEVVAADTAGERDVEMVEYHKGQKLRLKALCDGLWAVKNHNDVAVDYTWDVYGEAESGNGTVGANSNTNFTTSLGPKVVCLYACGVLQDQKASNPKPNIIFGKIDQGESPTTRTSLARGFSAQAPANMMNWVMQWNSVAGQTYHIERADDLTGEWTIVPASSMTGTGGLMSFTNTHEQEEALFYRVIIDSFPAP